MLRPKNIVKPAARYPADPRVVFILALSAFGGIGALIAQKGPGSLEAIVPQWGVITWGITLTIGSVLALIGLARNNDSGIITEQIGSVMVGVACIFYSTVVLVVAGLAASQPVGIILAWGFACLLRWVQLQLLIHERIRERMTEAITQELRGRHEPGAQ